MSDVETLAKQFTAHLEQNNTLIRELTAERDALRAFLDAARAEEAAGDYQALERTNAELNAELAARDELLRYVRKWKTSGDAELATRIDEVLGGQ